MKQYIGTKIIHAEPERKFVKGNEITEAHYKDGYKVAYPDGYVSWSPKDVFEEAYRPTDGMSFGLAIEAMKKGKKCARAGWNGKGMFLFITQGSTVPLENMKHREYFEGMCCDTVTINSHIDMKAADGTMVVGWLASQTDMLADDWYIVE